MDEFGLPLSFGKQAAAAPSNPSLPPKPEAAPERDDGRGPRGTVGGGKRTRHRHHRKPRTIPSSASGSNAVNPSDAADRGWGRRAGGAGEGGGEAYPHTTGNGAEHDGGVGGQAGVPGEHGDRALNAGVKRPLPASPSNNESLHKHTATPHGPREGGSRGRGRGGGGGGAGGGSRGRGQHRGGGSGGGDDRGKHQGGGESGFFKESFCEDPWKELLANKS